VNRSFIDALVLAEKVREIVGSGDKRKYYRFRPASFYGGIATADCVGCCLKCLFLLVLAYHDSTRKDWPILFS